MEYDKPHLDYNAQVQRLISRGLDVPDRAKAVAALKSIGYYRLSAYTYPLLKPGAEARTRSSDFVEGATLDEVLHLYSFDEKLRTGRMEQTPTPPGSPAMTSSRAKPRMKTS